ncbi:hypothetical protein ACFVV7_26620 [Streptomyces globisporus]|uniref:hypothetical protein n=1 Tax=Streptomyces globisporus TaxID=1908 RepID=UPI0036D8A375
MPYEQDRRPDYGQEDILVTYHWIPQREATEHDLPSHRVWNAAHELEGRAWRERQHRVNWGEDSLIDSVFYDFPDPQTLPEHERQTADALLRTQHRWPWLRTRKRLMRTWVTTHPDAGS